LFLVFEVELVCVTQQTKFSRRQLKMKKAFLKTISLMVMMMLLLSAVACGGKKTETEGENEATPTASNTTETNDKKEAPKEQVKLRYSSYLLDTAQAGKAYYDAIAEFEKANPDIKIEPDFIQNANYTAGIKTRILGGGQMDVFDTWSPSLFAEFYKLDDNIYLDLTGSEFLNDFLPAALEPVTIDGKVLGAPEVMHSDGLLYNKTMFDQKGWKIPKTWPEFIELCETIKKDGIIPIAMDSEWWVPQFFFGSIISCNGGDATWTAKLEKGEIKITDPIFVDAVKKQKEIIDRGFVPKDWTGLKHEQSKDLIGQGKAAMIITGTWDIPSIMDRDKNMDVDFMLVPGSNDKEPVPNINVGCYRVISSKTKYPEQAKKFVAFMNGKANQEKLAQGAKAVPSVKDAQLLDPISKKIAAVVTRPDAVIYWPHTVSTESLQVKILEGVNRYLAGDDLEKVLDEIQKAIDDARN